DRATQQPLHHAGAVDVCLTTLTIAKEGTKKTNERKRLAPLIAATERPTRTTVAAIASVLAAQLFGMPEVYWAAITVVIVMQSDVAATFGTSARRFAGTALGAALGATLTTYFGHSLRSE